MRQASSVRVVGGTCLVAAWLVGGAARGAAPKYKTQPLRLEKHDLVAESLVAAGRARMRKGDCEGALDAFDAALRAVVDYTIVRDRGVCNEKLGYTYPAIDDYRAYLTALPDAPDADVIRERLDRLEGNVEHEDVPDAPSQAMGARKDDSSALEADGSEAKSRSSLDYVSRDDTVFNSPLRAGSGVMLYPFFAERFMSNTTSGESWSESVGLGFRYSFNPSGALVVEAGYERFNATDLTQPTVSGLTSLVAYELRFPMQPSFANQLFLGFGVGYEQLSIQSIDASVSPLLEGAIVPRVRFGYRHMLRHALSLDVSLDGGATKCCQYWGRVPNDSVVAVVGANLALVWGL